MTLSGCAWTGSEVSMVIFGCLILGRRCGKTDEAAGSSYLEDQSKTEYSDDDGRRTLLLLVK